MLEVACLDLDDAFKCNLFLTDIHEFVAVNVACREYQAGERSASPALTIEPFEVVRGVELWHGAGLPERVDSK